MTTKEDLRQAVIRLATNFDKKFHLDWTQYKPKFCLGGRELSPRLSKNDMMMWMEAFEAGLECSRIEMIKDALRSAPTLPDGLTKESSPRIAEILSQWYAEYNDWYNKIKKLVNLNRCRKLPQ